MRTNHRFYSNLAFRLAETNLGKTKKNPSVGCIVVKNNSVISTGVTSLNGRPHAEFIALNKKINFEGSYMYVTLEPCTHYGKTPPCTKIIKMKKIKKVFYCHKDPFLTSINKKKYNLNGVISQLKNVDNNNKNFYESYYINILNNFPLIDAKLAISKDFFTINKKKKWITNLKSRNLAHLLRSKYDCIVSTSKSINKDDSLLNCRLNGFNFFSPDLIIIDRHLKIKKNLQLFDISKKRNTYIFTKKKDRKISFFKKKKIKVFEIKELNNKENLNSFFKKIFKLGKNRILIETGLTFLNQLLKYKLINNLFIFQSSQKIRKNGSNNSKIDYIKKLKLNNVMKVNLDGDRLIKIRIK